MIDKNWYDINIANLKYYYYSIDDFVTILLMNQCLLISYHINFY